jgi:hypothetical protein
LSTPHIGYLESGRLLELGVRLLLETKGMKCSK